MRFDLPKQEYTSIQVEDDGKIVISQDTGQVVIDGYFAWKFVGEISDALRAIDAKKEGV